MAYDIAATKARKAADGELRICLPQFLTAFFSVPAGDVRLRLDREGHKSNLPGGPGGLRADVVRDAAAMACMPCSV